jgi:hypothetical protein
MFIDRWSKPCFEYCEAHNLKFTGHYWEHGWPDLADGGDNMAMYAWHQMPAIDMLFNQFNEKSPQAQFGNVRAVKELSSVANQMGYRRTLSETYGGGGGEETFRDLKRLGDWEYALGVNFMNQHLSHLSIAGARKYDYPPTFSEHSPWWKYYRQLNLHFARLSMALSAGEQRNNILILEPTTSIWQYYSFAGSNGKMWDIANAFQSFITTLEKAQAEYDLGSENIIKDHGKITKDWMDYYFTVNKRSYSTVVIPPLMENLNAPTFNLLKQYIEKGHRVLAFSIPENIDGKPNAEVKKVFTEHANVIHLSELNNEVIEKQFGHSNIHIAKQGGNLFHHLRQMNDGQVLFLANSSLDEAVEGVVTAFGRSKNAILLNTLTGEIQDYPETVVDKYTIKIDFNIPPAGSLLLYICNRKQNLPNMPQKHERYAEIPASSKIVATPLEPNVLTIDFCDLYTDSVKFIDQHVFDAADKAFKRNGFDGGNPWNTSVQYRDNIVRRDTFTSGGFKAVYRFTTGKGCDTRRMQAMIERPWLYKVSLNGKEIHPSKNGWLDREMQLLDISKEVQTGENILALELSPMKIHAEIEPVYILGNFTVQPVAKGWELKPASEGFSTGSWKSQGWPFYSRQVSYRKTFDVDDAKKHYRVRLGNWSGTVAEVSVNGKPAGIIGFEPYSVDVSGLVRKGSNTVEVTVTGSNKNLLGPFHGNPAPGMVSPWHFRGVKQYPAGNDYHQLDYGLTDDFYLEVGS